jgi:hypothetical protein
LIAGFSMLLGGCANCNILDASMPAHCQAMLGGGMIVAAPILLPGALIEYHRDKQQDKAARENARGRKPGPATKSSGRP